MARVPFLRKRRRSKGQQALDLAKGAATVWTTMKASSASARAAKKGAKVYGAAKGAKLAGRSLVKVLALPAAVAGGVVVWRKVRGGSETDQAEPDRSFEPDRSPGPVSSAAAVSPPSSAAQTAEPSEAHAS
jgi:hypothetical protein